MTSPLLLTVVIPTHNRRAAVLRLLAALDAGSFDPARLEVVVVADGCDDDTVTAGRAARFRFPVTVIDQSPGRGPATARNAGAAAARAPLLLFLDDDIEPTPDLVSIHLEIHRESSGHCVVVGAPIPVRRPDADFHAIAVWGWWEQQFESMREPGHRFRYDEVFGGILSLPRDLFERVGGFDETFNGCREDPELGFRLLRAGAEIRFTREGGGLHHELRDRSQLLERKRAEGRADLLLARAHPSLWPVVRLSQVAGTSVALKVLRRLAFDVPPVGNGLLRLSSMLLDWLERLRWRGTWRSLHAATMYYAYWRGAVAASGGARPCRAALLELDDLSSKSAEPPRELEVDLAEGLSKVEDQVESDRPDLLRVRFGDFVLGVIPAGPGAERLAARHVRRQIARCLDGPLGVALALRGTGSESPGLEPSLALDPGS